MPRLDVELIPILKDNYAFLLTDPETGTRAVVDPGEAGPVLERLGDRTLDLVLITHHHADHIAGVEAIRAATGAKVVGNPEDRAALPPLDLPIRPGQTVQVGAATGQVLDVPGHAHHHVAYAFDGHVFCGDVLFVMGCGRVAEGTFEQMWRSLNTLAALPDGTKVWCGHEYTLSNARFAESVTPDDPVLEARVREIVALREKGLPTVPSTIGQEKATNVFLRAGSGERFMILRQAKDSF